jgi:hypothetical protein
MFEKSLLNKHSKIETEINKLYKLCLHLLGYNDMYFHLKLIDVSVKLSACAMLVSCLDYSLTPKMMAPCAFETSVDFQPTTWRYIPTIELFLHASLNAHYPFAMYDFFFSFGSTAQIRPWPPP